MNNVTEKTSDLVKAWIGAKKTHARAEDELRRATTILDSARRELGISLCPEDSVENEKFSIWFGSGILQVKYGGIADYHVSWRKEPDEKQKAEVGM